ncbi:MAG: FkbM family methyltransferase [Acidimicrobiia bacterium]|nr:FkbM family methyltransferase [Acidimicrobiia bacterium]
MTVTRCPVICGTQFELAGPTGDAYVESLEDGEPFPDDVLPLLEEILPADAVAFDVGANIGVYALALATLAPRGHVHAFEPNPNIVHHLRSNLNANDVANVVVHEAAVSSEAGSMRFKENPDFAAGSVTIDQAAEIFQDAYSAGAIEVPSVTIDDVVAENHLGSLDLLKIDTEGHELDVLRGSRRTLEQFRPLVALEFSSFALTMHRRLLPSDALEEVRSIFDRVFVTTTGRFREIHDEATAVEFLYENAFAAPVQDLFCVFNDSRLARSVERLAETRSGVAGVSEVDWLREQLRDHRKSVDWLQERLDAHEAALDVERRRADTAEAALDEKDAQLDALRATYSWRLTRPLRAVRRSLR